MKNFISKSFNCKIKRTLLDVPKFILGIFLLSSSYVYADTETQGLDKVVSIGGSITEIIYDTMF